MKLWTSKNIVLCPICNKPYEYCHGEFKIPYFRHKEKDKCEDVYSEPETEEHIKGKRDLFEWVKGQNNVTDAILEGWIPETHQRPDIMFKYNGEQYVIEYQCTPIASEYVKRHYLYKAAGIIDIWIVGTYNFGEGWCKRRKILEDYVFGYYDSSDKIFRFKEHSNELKLQCIDLSLIKKSVLKLSQKLKEDQNYKKQVHNAKIFILQNYNRITNYLNTLENQLNCNFAFCDKKSKYYLAKIYCNFKDKKSLTIFVNCNYFEVCYYDVNSVMYKRIMVVRYNVYDMIGFIKIILLIINRYNNGYFEEV